MTQEMSSSEEESYKGKFENVKWMVNSMQQELHTEKLRNKGVETLSACLEEERKKSRALEDQTKKQERGIAVLQSRLENLGENPSLTLQHGEILRPGSSRPLLESLMAENARLKRNQKFLDIDPSRMEQTLQDNEKLKRQLKQKDQNIEALQQKVDRIERQLRESASDKDRRILDLEDYVAELKRNKDTQSVLCHSLSEETTSLRQQLKDTMQKMQETMHRLELSDKQNVPLQDNEALAKAQATIAQLRQELEAQESQLQEVTTMNTRWQTYNKQRDQYVQELKQKLAERPEHPVEQQESKQMQHTIFQLRQDLHGFKQQKQKLQEENIQLKRQIEALQKRPEMSTLDQEKIHLYEAQIKVITEDFKQERDDRAREHERAEKLEKDLAEIKAQYDSLQRQHMQTYADRRQRSLENYEQQYFQNTYGNSAASRQRNIGAQQAAFVPRGPVRYECDNVANDNEEEDEERSEDVVDSPENDVLQCPKCGRSFPMDQHGELIEHLDKC